MGYKCAVFSCDTGYEGGEKHLTFFFPTDMHLKGKLEKLVNWRDWKCSLFPPYMIILLCVVPTDALKAHKERNVVVNDEWEDFKTSDVVSNFSRILPDVCPKDFSYLKQETYVLMYRLVINKATRIPVINESIMANESLHVYLGYHVPLPFSKSL